ncbi:MAG TPA: polymer-forming cytoskeletal protein [Methanocorpusculum sp.]|nr:polymer-forming cytoskeletal protein [Methanocorpusculum sp.]
MAVLYKGNQYMAERGSFFSESVKIDGDFLVGPRSTFWKNLVVSGNIYLCPECHIKGNVLCYGGVVGHECIIEGEFKAIAGPVTLCDNAALGKVTCQGDVMVRPGVRASEVYGDMITVVGKAKCGKLMGKKTRVVSADS